MRRVFAKLMYEMEKQNDCVLVTIVKSSGSSPRGAGSQMLVSALGRVEGSIGGGALEKEAQEIAVSLVAEKRSELREFHLESVGMLCGGDVTAHFQFIGASDARWNAVIKSVAECFAQNRAGTLLLRLSGEVGALTPPGAAIENGDTFCVPLPLGERAVIFGAGHVARALVPILKSVDFRIVVFDDRPEYAKAEFFPDAESVILGDFSRIEDGLKLRPDDYIAIMTSAHKHDFEAEFQALQTRRAYIGVMGSARKTAAVNKMLAENGIPERRLKDVHTPIGTAIKAVTPAEIAVSVAGEMILCRALTRA